MNLEKMIIQQNEKQISHKTREFEALKKQWEAVLFEAQEQDLDQLERFGFSPRRPESKVRYTEDQLSLLKLLESDPRFVLESEIEEIAIKYRFRFLQPKHYKGFIPPELNAKIKEALEYLDSLSQFVSVSGDLFVLAPEEEFHLETIPKVVDPLLFVRVPNNLNGENIYYLIHKWGNDLTFSRRIYGFIFKNDSRLFWVTNSIIFGIAFFLLKAFTSLEIFGSVIMGLAAVLVYVMGLIAWASIENYGGYISNIKEVWNSNIK